LKRPRGRNHFVVPELVTRLSGFEALLVHQVEVDPSDEIGDVRSHGVQAAPEARIASAVGQHHAEVVAHVQAALAGLQHQGAVVVLAAARVFGRLAPQVVVAVGAVPRPAPLGPREDERPVAAAARPAAGHQLPEDAGRSRTHRLPETLRLGTASSHKHKSLTADFHPAPNHIESPHSKDPRFRDCCTCFWC